MKVKYATIIVRDMEESVGFYRDVLGFEVGGQHRPAPGLAITLMKAGGDAMIELIENPSDDVGLYSVGMEVEDIYGTVDHLKSRGAKVTMEPVPITVGFLAFCEDPNGAKIALVQHHGDLHGAH